MGLIFGVIITGIGVVLAMGIICFVMSKFDDIKYADVKDEHTNKFNEDVLKYNLVKENIKENIRFSMNEGSIIYTNDNRLFVLKYDKSNALKFTIHEVKLEGILEMSIDIELLERNRRRVISLTPTFDSFKSIRDVIFTIITENEIYKMRLNVSTGVFGSDYKIINETATYKPDFNISLDKMKRIKLLVERQIENLKKIN